MGVPALERFVPEPLSAIYTLQPARSSAILVFSQKGLQERIELPRQILLPFVASPQPCCRVLGMTFGALAFRGDDRGIPRYGAPDLGRTLPAILNPVGIALDTVEPEVCVDRNDARAARRPQSPFLLLG